MKELRNLLIDFYQQIILRDFFARITPGTLIMISLFLVFDIQINVDLRIFFLFTGFSWILGFMLQTVGETLGLMKPYSKKVYANDTAWFEALDTFKKTTRIEDQRTLKRLTTIQEAAGNLSVSFLLTLLFIMFFKLYSISQYSEGLQSFFQFIPIIILAVIIIIILQITHQKFVQRQTNFVFALTKPKTTS